MPIKSAGGIAFTTAIEDIRSTTNMASVSSSTAEQTLDFSAVGTGIYNAVVLEIMFKGAVAYDTSTFYTDSGETDDPKKQVVKCYDAAQWNLTRVILLLDANKYCYFKMNRNNAGNTTNVRRMFGII